MYFSDNDTILGKLLGNNLNFKLKQGDVYKNKISQNVDKFIEQQQNQEYYNDLFRVTLKKKLQKQIQKTDQLSKIQVRQLLPFVFDSSQLPDFFLTLAVSATLKIPFQSVDIKKLEKQAVQQIAYKLVYSSVADGDPKLGMIIQKYANLTQNSSFVNGSSKRIALSLFVQMIGKIRLYGQILINGLYLEKYGIRNFENGEYQYNVIQLPNLIFKFSNGKVYAFQSNGKIKNLIPQANFNYDFLRSMIKGIYIVKNAGVMKAFNNYMLPAIQRPDLKNFKEQYMK